MVKDLDRNVFPESIVQHGATGIMWVVALMDSREMKPGFFVDILDDFSSASANLSKVQKERNVYFASKFAHACLNAGGAAKWAQVEGKALRKKEALFAQAYAEDEDLPPVCYDDIGISNRGALPEDIK